MPDADDPLIPPKTGRSDTVHALAKGLVGQIPVVGSTAAELFGLMVAPALERRRGEWMETVAEALRRIEARFHRGAEELSQDESFMDTFLRISQVAGRTHQTEKRQSLLNALVNAAGGEAIDDSVQHMFVTWIDELTVWHLRLLELLADPVQWFRGRNLRLPEYHLTSSLVRLVTDALPELAGKGEILEQIARDLNSRGLAKVDHQSLFTMMSGSGAFAKRSTRLGDQFLVFISDAEP